MSLVVKSNFMVKCVHISLRHRKILIDWLFEVCMNWKMEEYTLHLAIHILDAYISCTSSLDRKDFQKVGVICLYIASKIEERYTTSISDLVFICANVYTAKEFLEMEETILKSLDYDIMFETFLNYRDRIFDNCNNMSNLYMDYVLFDPVLMHTHDRYDIVESCVALATEDKKYWSRCMNEIEIFVNKFTKSELSKHVKRYRSIKPTTNGIQESLN